MLFRDTFNPCSFNIFSSEIDFQNDADSMVTYIRRALGGDVLNVELSSKTIWDAMEEATLEWSRLVNEYQARSNLSTLLGQTIISGTTIENLYPRESLEFLIRQAEPYSMAASYAGYHTEVSGSIILQNGRQDYDLWNDLLDSNGQILINQTGTYGGNRMRVTEVFHFSPQAAYRFFDSTSAINYLNNEFSFESFTPETIFYVLPVFEDLLRASQMGMSQRVRRSNYSYRLIGHNIRIFPIPTRIAEVPQRLFIRVSFPPSNTTGPLGTNVSGSIPDPTVAGISNLSNIPYGNIPYRTINSVGRQWIRQYCLALCMIRLAWIRGKVRTIPIPGNDVELNHEALLSKGFEEKEKLLTQLRETLESLTYDKLVENQALKAENLMKQLKLVPIPNGKMIVMG